MNIVHRGNYKIRRRTTVLSYPQRGWTDNPNLPIHARWKQCHYHSFDCEGQDYGGDHLDRQPSYQAPYPIGEVMQRERTYARSLNKEVLGQRIMTYFLCYWSLWKGDKRNAFQHQCNGCSRQTLTWMLPRAELGGIMCAEDSTSSSCTEWKSWEDGGRLKDMST